MVLTTTHMYNDYVYQFNYCNLNMIWVRVAVLACSPGPAPVRQRHFCSDSGHLQNPKTMASVLWSIILGLFVGGA